MGHSATRGYPMDDTHLAEDVVLANTDDEDGLVARPATQSDSQQGIVEVAGWTVFQALQLDVPTLRCVAATL